MAGKRILFTALSGYGHVYPLLPLASAAHAAGHDVHFATSGDWIVRLRHLGLTTHRVGITLQEAEARIADRADLRDLPPSELWRLGAALFGDVFATAAANDLLPVIARTEPDVVVYDEYDLGAAIAAHATGTPAVGHALGRQPAAQFRNGLADALAPTWSAFTDVPFADPFRTDAYIDICPPTLRDDDALAPGRQLPQQSVAQVDQASELPEWITTSRSRPLVYVTLGTVVFGAVESLRAAIAGLARLDVDVLVTVGPKGDVDALGPLPARVHAARFVPQDTLLPHVDVAVHHCGSGTLLGALALGIPQLAIPHGADQFWNADALVRAGAGLQWRRDEITPERITGGTDELLRNGKYRDAAARIAGEIATMPTPTANVGELVAIADEGAAKSRAKTA